MKIEGAKGPTEYPFPTSAHGVLLGPVPCICLVLAPVCLVHVGNLWHQGVIGIRVGQERTDREQHLIQMTSILRSLTQG